MIKYDIDEDGHHASYQLNFADTTVSAVFQGWVEGYSASEAWDDPGDDGEFYPDVLCEITIRDSVTNEILLDIDENDSGIEEDVLLELQQSLKEILDRHPDLFDIEFSAYSAEVASLELSSDAE